MERSPRTWRGPQSIGGIAGLGGGLLVPVGAALSSPALFLLGIVLIAVCDLALVSLLGRVSKIAAGCAVLTLGLGVMIGAIGTANLLIAPAFIAIGMVCWLVAAAVAALLVARAKLLSMPPAAALAVMTAVWLILSPTGLGPGHPISQGVLASYLLSWAWLGAAMLQRGIWPHGARAASPL